MRGNPANHHHRPTTATHPHCVAHLGSGLGVPDLHQRVFRPADDLSSIRRERGRDHLVQVTSESKQLPRNPRIRPLSTQRMRETLQHSDASPPSTHSHKALTSPPVSASKIFKSLQHYPPQTCFSDSFSPGKNANRELRPPCGITRERCYKFPPSTQLGCVAHLGSCVCAPDLEKVVTSPADDSRPVWRKCDRADTAREIQAENLPT